MKCAILSIKNKIVRDFFDLYAISDLKFLFVNIGVESFRRNEIISESHSNKINDLYPKVRKDLEKWMKDEFDCENLKYLTSYRYKDNFLKIKKEKDFNQMICFFNKRIWQKCYGGKKWGKPPSF